MRWHFETGDSMCDHDNHGISRRGLAALGVGAAAIGLLPSRVFAAGPVDALCIMCIDYRLVDTGVGFFDDTVGHQKFDIVVLAGASLAGTSRNMFMATVPGFWQQVDAARNLHDINKVLVLDHMDCGAYKVEFNGGNSMPPDVERQKHIETMQTVKGIFSTRTWGSKGPPPQGIEFYLTTPAGKPIEHIPI